VNIYVYIYMYTYTYTYIYIYVHIYTHSFITGAKSSMAVKSAVPQEAGIYMNVYLCFYVKKRCI
jgi:hypothetical protein